jgi:DNA-binding NtrC family response regulator
MTPSIRTTTLPELLRRAYRPTAPAEQVLGALLRELAEHTQAVSGTLGVRDLGTFVLGRRGWTPAVEFLPEIAHDPPSERPDAFTDYTGSVDDAVMAADWQSPTAPRPAVVRVCPPAVGGPAVPITYAGATIGRLALSFREEGEHLDAVLALCAEVARRVAFLVKRHALRLWAQERLGRPVVFAGTSDRLHAMEMAIERTVRSEVPVLIRGEFGTEKANAALAIHAAGSKRSGPLVEVNCALEPSEAAPLLLRSFTEARGGTLFLNGIDELPPAAQNQLVPLLCSRNGQWVGVRAAPEVRVLCATTADLSEHAREGRFSRALLAELDFLSVDVPPLRERRADIESLLTLLLERHGFRPERKRTDALVDLCEGYEWPENLIELERTIVRLAVLTEDRPISRADVADHAPFLVNGGAAPRTLVPPAAAPIVRASPAAVDRCARAVVARDLSGFGKLHEGMQRALGYLSEHYQDQISLGQLARHARVSPSHLSFLFKRSIGTTFKPFLGRVRVEKAKSILAADGRTRITEVAMNVGFTDLSHFEKPFRRIVGRSPRAFRRSAEELPPQYDA